MSKKVISGESDVMITLPAPAKPYFTPRKELTINAMFKTELLRIYFRECTSTLSGFLSQYNTGKNASDMIKKRQKMMVSMGRL